MDFWSIVGTILSSIGISAGAAAWLAQRLVNHRLEKDFETFKVSLTRDLQHDKAEWEGRVRKDVEVFLGERGAQREYELDARKRLYTAVGPLKFQLAVACRDYASRIVSYGTGARYSTDIGGYYGKSTLYRVLKPIALSELIERQMTYSDFSVDPSVASLLQFKSGAFAAFTSGSIIVPGQPGVNWTNQHQHVFYDNLSRAANAIIVATDGSQPRVLRFHEFDEFLNDSANVKRLDPLPRLFSHLQISEQPIFWVRLLAYGLLCHQFERSVGSSLGFGDAEYALGQLLRASEDPFLQSHISEYEELCRALVSRAGLPAAGASGSVAPTAAGG